MANAPEIFRKGVRYRVKKSFMSGASTFIGGEILVFDLDGYSFYDESYGYQFHGQGNGEIKTWMLDENRSVDSWKQYFEEVP